MIFKKLFHSNSLNPHFRFNQNGNIWRIYFNSRNIITGETRDLKMKQASIFSFDYNKKEVYLKNFQFDEKWWFAIDGINEKFIIISYFKHPEVPEHKGFELIDIKTGQKIWGNGELEYYFVNESELFAIKQLFESKIVYKLNVENGETIKEYKSDDEICSVMELKEENDSKIYEGLINTEIFEMDDVIVKSCLGEIISRLQNVNLQGEIEYIKDDKYLIYNYHFNSDVSLNFITNKLEIFDTTTKNIVYEDILNNETSSYVPDSFFLRKGFLFYIKEKSELICIDLNIE